MSTMLHEQRWTQEGRPRLNRRNLPPADGPWMSEPDKAHWIDAKTDMDCLAVRNSFGAWCGYVAVTEGHPYFEVGYGECVEKCDQDWCYEHSPEGRIKVHGGITYADFCAESDKGEEYGICHTPLPGRPHRVWWFGFDTAHAGDLTPYDAAQAAAENYRYPWTLGDDKYRDLTYVQSECSKLARQLAAVSA